MYKVYVLPNEKYCGVTKRDLSKRLWEHKNISKRDITNAHIIAEFESKQEALRFEEEYQITNVYLGYIYGNNWRKIQSDKCLKDKPSSYKQKKIQCIDNGMIFNSVRECERYFNVKSGNLTKHLKGHPQHKTFIKLKFKYYE
jgi:hypothetical protein